MSQTTTPPQFGIMTPPSQVAYGDILRVWREADTIPQIEHAWLFDHLMPAGGDLAGPALEGWTCSPPSPGRPNGYYWDYW